MQECIIELKQLSKAYRSRTVLHPMDLQVYRGEIFGLIGRNGAGKSTLLKMLGGLIYPTGGSVQLFERSTREQRSLHERMGLLVENPGLYTQLSGFDNMELLADAYGMKGRKPKIEELLDRVGLLDSSRRKVKEYSLGMKQRLGIALALLGSPDVLVLDEPINGLDPQGIVYIRHLLLELNKAGLTIVIASHILEELSKMATRFGILHEGRLVETVSRDELLQQCEQRIEIRLAEPEAAIPILEAELGIRRYKLLDSQLLQVYDEHAELFQIHAALVKGGVTVHGIARQQVSLEQYFLERTGSGGEQDA